MTKNDLIAVVAEKTGLTKIDAGKAIDAALDAVTAELANGGDVQIAGFGKLEVRDRAARTGKDPRTGAVINIPATKTPAFIAGKALKEAVKK